MNEVIVKAVRAYLFVMAFVFCGSMYSISKMASLALGTASAGGLVWLNGRVERAANDRCRGCSSLVGAIGTGALCWKKKEHLAGARYPLVLASLLMGTDALQRLYPLRGYTANQGCRRMLIGSALFGLGYQAALPAESVFDSCMRYMPYAGLALREIIRLYTRPFVSEEVVIDEQKTKKLYLQDVIRDVVDEENTSEPVEEVLQPVDLVVEEEMIHEREAKEPDSQDLISGVSGEEVAPEKIVEVAESVDLVVREEVIDEQEEKKPELQDVIRDVVDEGNASKPVEEVLPSVDLVVKAKASDQESKAVELAGGRVARVSCEVTKDSAVVCCVVSDHLGQEITKTSPITVTMGEGNWVRTGIHVANEKQLVMSIIIGCNHDDAAVLKRVVYTIQGDGQLVFRYEETLVGRPIIFKKEPFEIGDFSEQALQVDLFALGHLKYQFKRTNIYKLSDGKVVSWQKKFVEKDGLVCGQFLCMINNVVLEGGIEFSPAEQEHRIFFCECENKQGFWLATVNDDQKAQSSKICFTRFDKDDTGVYAHTATNTFFAATIESVCPRTISGVYEEDGKLCVAVQGEKVWSVAIPSQITKNKS